MLTRLNVIYGYRKLLLLNFSPSPPTASDLPTTSGDAHPHPPQLRSPHQDQHPVYDLGIRLEHSARQQAPLFDIPQLGATCLEVPIPPADHVTIPSQTLPPHSTASPLQHPDYLVLSRNQFDQIAVKLDQLGRRVQNLEDTVARDVKTILEVLQSRRGSGESPHHKESPSKVEVNYLVFMTVPFYGKRSRDCLPSTSNHQTF